MSFSTVQRSAGTDSRTRRCVKVRASACAHARRARWPLTLSHIWTMWRSLSSLQPPGLFYLSIFDFVIDEEMRFYNKILAGCRGGSVSLLVRPMFTLLYFILYTHVTGAPPGPAGTPSSPSSSARAWWLPHLARSKPQNRPRPCPPPPDAAWRADRRAHGGTR